MTRLDLGIPLGKTGGNQASVWSSRQSAETFRFCIKELLHVHAAKRSQCPIQFVGLL